MQRDHYISHFETMPGSFLNLTLDQAVTQYGQLLFGIFNLSIVTGKLSIVSNHIDNIFQIVKYLLTEDLRIHHVPVSHYTASMISPPCGHCQESAPTYLPAYTKMRRRKKRRIARDKLLIQGR